MTRFGKVFLGLGVAGLLVGAPLPGFSRIAEAKTCSGYGFVFKNGKCRCRSGLVKRQGECVNPAGDVEDDSCPNGYVYHFKSGKCRLDEVPKPYKNVERECAPGRHWEPGPDGGCVRD
jgi:hypothetical protein